MLWIGLDHKASFCYYLLSINSPFANLVLALTVANGNSIGLVILRCRQRSAG